MTAIDRPRWDTGSDVDLTRPVWCREGAPERATSKSGAAVVPIDGSSRVGPPRGRRSAGSKRVRQLGPAASTLGIGLSMGDVGHERLIGRTIAGKFVVEEFLGAGAM